MATVNSLPKVKTLTSFFFYQFSSYWSSATKQQSKARKGSKIKVSTFIVKVELLRKKSER